MDNLCHTLTGWTIARAGIERLSPWATVTCIIGANLPDIDIVTALQGELVYLEHHRGITHSVIGLAAQSVLLAGIVRGVNWFKTRYSDFTSTANFSGLLIAGAAGLFSHLLLDWTNSYGIRPWLPFEQGWYYGDLVFVVEPWLWLLFGAALFLGTSKTLANSKGWILLFLLLAVFVVLASLLIIPNGLGFAPWLWCAILAAVIVAKSFKTNLNKTKLARSAIFGYLLYLLVLGVIHSRAVDSVVRITNLIDPPERVEKVDANPLPMRPDRWNLFIVTSDRIIKNEYDFSNTNLREVSAVDRQLDQPAAKAALATCRGKLAEHFDRYLRIQIQDDKSRWKVDLIDERFPVQNGRRSLGQITIWLNSDLIPIHDEPICSDL